MVKRRSEAGQTMPLVALAMVTLLACAGLAVDMGYMRYQKRLMQTAADSAALAAATDLNLADPTQYQNDALAVAAQNGFQDGVNNTTVAVNNIGLLGTASRNGGSGSDSKTVSGALHAGGGNSEFNDLRGRQRRRSAYLRIAWLLSIRPVPV